MNIKYNDAGLTIAPTITTQCDEMKMLFEIL